MIVKTWVEISQEVDVDVSIADVMSSIAELADTDQLPMLLDCINRAHQVLREIPAAQIDRMNEKQRAVIGDALRVQAERFLKPNTR